MYFVENPSGKIMSANCVYIIIIIIKKEELCSFASYICLSAAAAMNCFLLKQKKRERKNEKKIMNYCSTVSKKVTTVHPERSTQRRVPELNNERTLYKVCICVTLQIDLAT